MTTPVFQLGRRPPKNAPALHLASFLTATGTGTAPAHPTTADNLSQVPDYGLYGNDRYGDCGPTSVANMVRQVTRYLTGHEQAPTLTDVLDLYQRSGNPNFDPADPGGPGDAGVDMQTMLEAVHTGGIAGTPCVGFAKVDHTDLGEVRAAIAIFGSVLLGVSLDTAQQAQTSQGIWDYTPSPQWGGHAVLAGAYTSATTGTDLSVITWGDRVGATDEFLRHQLDEAWVVIWPWHLGTTEFQQGVDVAALAADYLALTGRPFPGHNPPPQPAPSPVDVDDRALAAVLRPWVTSHHTGGNHQVALAAQRWLAAKNLTATRGPRHATRTELAAILAETDLDPALVKQVLARLDDLGVQTSGLVTITEEYP